MEDLKFKMVGGVGSLMAGDAKLAGRDGGLSFILEPLGDGVTQTLGHSCNRIGIDNREVLQTKWSLRRLPSHLQRAQAMAVRLEVMAQDLKEEE